MRGLEISPEKSSTRKNAQTFCHKNSMARGCADSPKLNLSDLMNYSPQKIYCSYFNAPSIMKAFSLTLLTDHDSAQLNRKAIITPKAFSFHQKKDSPFPLNFVTWRQDDRCKLNKVSALRPLGLLLDIACVANVSQCAAGYIG